MAHLIVVDGYNLIHRTPDLRPGPDRTLEQSRDKLINLLSWTVGTGDARFLVVFDGEDGPEETSGSGRVKVRFSRRPQTADDVIRAIVEAEIDRVEQLTVVTADLEVARHARAQGATISISDLFVASLLGPQAGGSGEIEKPASLSRRELEEWAEIFRTRRKDSGGGEEKIH